MAILDDNEFVEVDGRYYTNPQVSLDESNAFIDNLRSTQQANNQKIQTDTYNLGTAVPSNLGGLTSPVGEGGAGDAGLSYFTSRYQTPQTNAAVENLRAVAQASALNQALENEQEIWKKKYNDAYRAYQKSAYRKSSGGGGSGGGNGGGSGDNTSGWQGDTKLKSTDGQNNDNDGDKKTSAPPNPEDYYIDGKEQTERIQERIKDNTGVDTPDWLINILKIFG